MRLSDLKGFEFQPSTDDVGTTSLSAISSQEEYRLIAFASSQAKPIYISEKFSSDTSKRITTNEISFEHSPWRRGFMLAIQLQTSGEVKREWIIDLRQARLVKNVKEVSDLSLITEDGLMSIPSSENDTTSLNSQVSISTTPNGASADKTSSHNISPNTVSPDSASQRQIRSSEMIPNNSRRQQIPIIPSSSSYSRVHSRTNSFERRDPRSAEVNADVKSTGRPGAASGSLISRWLPLWGQNSNGQQKNGANDAEKVTSLSYSTLVDLWTLQKILDEAQAASKELCDEIDSISVDSPSPVKEEESQMRMRSTKMQKKRNLLMTEIQKQRDHAQNLKSRQRKIQESLNCSMEHNTRRSNIEKELVSMSHRYKKLICREQARLASQLLEIFPIEPLADGKFHFAIRGIILPSVFAINHFDTAQIAAALGFVAQVVVSLSRYLDIALPYPITVCGSQSYITDNISFIKHGSRNFPSWTRGALLYRVEYALYLLHKDIDQSMTSLNIDVADLKQTSANLKNALLVVSSYT